MYNNIFNSFSDMEKQLINLKRSAETAYICSPLNAGTKTEVQDNICAARTYMAYSIQKMGIYARAPHGYLPLILSDDIPSERVIALKFGCKVLEVSNFLFVCGNRLSVGMMGEIAQAAQLGIEIRVFNEKLYPDVEELVIRNGGIKEKVILDLDNKLMSLSARELNLTSFKPESPVRKVTKKCYASLSG